MSVTKLSSRLQDPSGVLKDDPARMARLQELVSKAMTQLAQQPMNGGHPFLFALTAPKPHELAAGNALGGGRKFTTAATDGKKFFWHPDFLEKLGSMSISTVMQHEGYHVLFSHVPRGQGRDPQVWNWAIDYVVNAVIEADHEEQKRKGDLWGGELGQPLSLKDLLDYLGGKDTLPKDGHFIFADKTLRGRSPESIYEEIQKAMKNSPRKCPTCGGIGGQKQKSKSKGKDDGGKDDGGKDPGGKKGQGKDPGDGSGGKGKGQKGQGDPSDDHEHSDDGSPCNCGGDHDGDGQGDSGDGCPTCGGGLGSMDQHMLPNISKDEAIQEALKAADTAKQMRGTVPAGIEGLLAELQKPQLSWQDLVRHCFQRKKIDAGNKNDWKRFRRRPMSFPVSQYIPRKYDHKPRWVCLLDTSGSMGDDDIAYGVSQLQVLGNDTEGFIVPIDAQCHWDAVTPVKGSGDLKRTKVVGRGGTVFNQFFEELPKKLGVDFDVVICITDGYFGDIPKNLAPRSDCVWVITNGQQPSVPFGRVAPLRNSRT